MMQSLKQRVDKVLSCETSLDVVRLHPLETVELIQDLANIFEELLAREDKLIEAVRSAFLEGLSTPQPRNAQECWEYSDIKELLGI